MEGNQLKHVGMLQLFQEAQFPEVLILMQNVLVLCPVVSQVMGARGSVAVRLDAVSVER